MILFFRPGVSYGPRRSVPYYNNTYAFFLSTVFSTTRQRYGSSFGSATGPFIWDGSLVGCSVSPGKGPIGSFTGYKTKTKRSRQIPYIRTVYPPGAKQTPNGRTVPCRVLKYFIEKARKSFTSCIFRFIIYVLYHSGGLV